MRKVCYLFASLLMAVLPLSAQTQADAFTFEGRVVNAQGIPIKAAVVMGLQSGVSVATGMDGLVKVSLPATGDSLVFSKDGLTPFILWVDYNCKGVVVLNENGGTLMANSEYVKQMEGTAKTYFEAGLKFLEGDAGQAPDHKKAFACFWRAANMEHLVSKFYVGKLYDEGLGIGQDYAAAIEWYNKAAANADAQRRLGEMYAEGLGVPQDYKQAAEHFRSAMYRGDSIIAPKSLEQLVEKGLVKEEDLVDNNIYDVVEKNASFPGGDQAVYAWLAQHVRYPRKAQEQGIQGRVMVQFVVNKDGSIVDVTVIRSPDPSLAKEAFRVVSEMPKWQPATQGRKPVRSRFTIPVMFKLS